MQYIETHLNTDWLIETPEGFVDFYGIAKTEESETISIEDKLGNCLEGSPNHVVSLNGELISLENIYRKKLLKTKHNNTKKNLFDIIEVKTKDHLYNANNFVNHNCKFLSSTNSVFDYITLEKTSGKVNSVKAVYTEEGFGLYIYDEILYNLLDNENTDQDSDELRHKKENFKKYCLLTIDIGEGLDQDFSVCNILLIDPVHFKIHQVGLIRSNKLSIDGFAGYIYSICKRIGNPLVIFENNNKSGGEFKKTFFEQLGYGNCFQDVKNSKKGTTDIGVYTTNTKKRIAVKTLLTLIQKDILEINNYETFLEMNYFEENPPMSGKYAAQLGYNDDIILSFMFFCYIYQNYKDYFALKYGRTSIIDAMINPVLFKNDIVNSEEQIVSVESKEEVYTISDKLLKESDDKKKEDFSVYDIEIETENGSKLNLKEFQEFGGNMGFWHSGGITNSKGSLSDKPKNILL